jgi:hypothetical protein
MVKLIESTLTEQSVIDWFKVLGDEYKFGLEFRFIGEAKSRKIN